MMSRLWRVHAFLAEVARDTLANLESHPFANICPANVHNTKKEARKKVKDMRDCFVTVSYSFHIFNTHSFKGIS